jgi:hypothetical protein
MVAGASRRSECRLDLPLGNDLTAGYGWRPLDSSDQLFSLSFFLFLLLLPPGVRRMETIGASLPRRIDEPISGQASAPKSLLALKFGDRLILETMPFSVVECQSVELRGSVGPTKSPGSAMAVVGLRSDGATRMLDGLKITPDNY